MAAFAKDFPEHPGLAEALERAVAALNKMSPEEKREMHRAQRKSWVIGEMMLEHPEMSREEAERLYDEVCP
ncbi:hypothetical protein [Bradyrhizobium neotropicale]|uniref:hypothetical protein n=1 Tax=Bradyrhizobium neotropicale TaxID=1497615 RepID=UPI001AD69535|nr:hypothetical protein [Bradyrhizobium neotropicale]MBO4228051.1 hypothetical protein [Bradyrhizobium neotropicale]